MINQLFEITPNNSPISLIPFGNHWSITGSTNEFTAISDADDTTFVNSPNLLPNSNEVSPGNRQNFLGASITYPNFNFKNPRVAVRVRDANSMINLVITCNLVWYLTPIASTITNLTPYSAEDPNLYKMITSTQITPDNFDDLTFDFSSQNNDIPLLTDIDNSSPYGKSFWIEISAFNPNLGTFGVGISKLCFTIDENDDLPPGSINDVFEITPPIVPPVVLPPGTLQISEESYIELYAIGYDQDPPNEDLIWFQTISQRAIPLSAGGPRGSSSGFVAPTLPGFSEPRTGLSAKLTGTLEVNYDGSTIEILSSNILFTENSGAWSPNSLLQDIPVDASIGFFDNNSTINTSTSNPIDLLGTLRTFIVKPYTTFSVPLTTISPTLQEWINDSIFYKISFDMRLLDLTNDPMFNGDDAFSLIDFDVIHHIPLSMIPIPSANSIEFMDPDYLITIPISWKVRLDTLPNAGDFIDFYFVGQIVATGEL